MILQTFLELQQNLNNCGFFYISVAYYIGNKAKIFQIFKENSNNNRTTGKRMEIKESPGCSACVTCDAHTQT